MRSVNRDGHNAAYEHNTNDLGPNLAAFLLVLGSYWVIMTVY